VCGSYWRGDAGVKGDHGTLALTELSAEVLRGERQVMLRRTREGAVRTGGRGGSGGRSGGRFRAGGSGAAVPGVAAGAQGGRRRGAAG